MFKFSAGDKVTVVNDNYADYGNYLYKSGTVAGKFKQYGYIIYLVKFKDVSLHIYEGDMALIN